MADKEDILEWVIDAELFEKFSSDMGQISMDSLLRERLESRAFKLDDIHEAYCLQNFLDAIINGKNKVCFNMEILEKYAPLVAKLPIELSKPLKDIITVEDNYKEIMDPFMYREIIRGTELEKQKLEYISVAYFIRHKKIVSTGNDIKGCYHKYPDKLVLVKIDCKEVCEAWEEIKRHGD